MKSHTKNAASVTKSGRKVLGKEGKSIHILQIKMTAHSPGRHDIAEILLKVALKHKKSNH
jgi:hypothetical protein